MVKTWLATWLLLGGVLVGMGMVPLGVEGPFAAKARSETRRKEGGERRKMRRLERRLRHEHRKVSRIKHREHRQKQHLHRMRRR
jgi:hypothetical protein